MHGTEEASNDGRVRVRIIHGLNISHKKLTYLLQRYTSHQKPSITRMLLGEGLVGVNHRAIPTSTQRMTIKKINHAPTSSHNGSPYVHATGTTNFNTSISQIHNQSTSTTLISLSPYLKTIIKYQTSHSIQCTLYESFYIKANFHVVLKDSQNNISKS